METEVWKDIPGYEGLYQASTMGRIRSLDKIINYSAWNRDWKSLNKSKVLKPVDNGNGYITVSIRTKEVGFKTKYVHRLVALTFLSYFIDKPEINHKNGIRNDNRIENLEWCTRSFNLLHSVNILGCEKGIRKKVSKIDSSGKVIETYRSLKDAGISIGTTPENISSVCRGKTKTAGGFIWKYE